MQWAKKVVHCSVKTMELCPRAWQVVGYPVTAIAAIDTADYCLLARMFGVRSRGKGCADTGLRSMIWTRRVGRRGLEINSMVSFRCRVFFVCHQSK